MENIISHFWLVSEKVCIKKQQQKYQKQQHKHCKYHDYHYHHHYHVINHCRRIQLEENHFQADSSRSYCNCSCFVKDSKIYSNKYYKYNTNYKSNNNENTSISKNRELYCDRCQQTHSIASCSLQYCYYHPYYYHYHHVHHDDYQSHYRRWRKPHKSKCWPHSLRMENILSIKACYNQIVEVLLVLLLVNCVTISLIQLPMAAAYSSSSSVSLPSFSPSSSQLASSVNSFASPVTHNSNYFEDALSNNIHYRRHDDCHDRYEIVTMNSQLNINEQQKLLGIFSRRPHSIGGSAFGFNGHQVQNNFAEFDLQNTVGLRSQNFKIIPKPCAIGQIEGTCMFVWECIKSEGRHVGMCVDSFMFGSCCVHNYTENIILPTAFSYTRPTKPVGMASLNHRPPHQPHRPSINGMTTIERPHGAGTLVIRPSGPHHQSALGKPQYVKPSSTMATLSSTPSHWSSSEVHIVGLQSVANIASSTVHQQHWHLSTEPNFITRPRPPVWEKPATYRPKPLKPSKKPTNSSSMWLIDQHQHQHQHHVHHVHHQHAQQYITTAQTVLTNQHYSTRKPTKPTTTLATNILWSSSLSPLLSSVTSSTTMVMRPKPTAMIQQVKPSKLPTTTRPYSKPTTSSSQTNTYTHISAISNNNSNSDNNGLSNFIITYSSSPINFISRPTLVPPVILQQQQQQQYKPKPRPTLSSALILTRTTRRTTTSSPSFSTSSEAVTAITPLTLLETVPPTSTAATTRTSNTTRTTTAETPITAIKTPMTISSTSATTNALFTAQPIVQHHHYQQQQHNSTFSIGLSLPITTTIAVTTLSGSSNHDILPQLLQSTQLPKYSTYNHNNIESNEIVDNINNNDNDDDNNDTDNIVKTISAARSECGVPLLTRPETRIVGGKSAPFGRWPWQVSVRRTSFFGFSSTHRCGGALINENWIATAGHCVDDLLISQIRIRVGEYDFSHVQEQLPYIERGVAHKIVHPQYNFFTYEYDLALVKLEQGLQFAPHVSPICLPQTDSLLIGMNATVTGWGRLSEGGTLPSVLQEVSVPIVSNDNCKSMFLKAGRQEFIPEIFLCAGYETGGQDSCQGDSGGPLQVKSQNGRYFLAGIISWGIGCAEANLPGVCTRISKFVPWILETLT